MIVHSPTASSRQPSRSLLWPLAGLLLIIIGCKLWLVASFSSPLPFLDQWKGEGAEVLRPWMKGDLRADDLVAPFNEHRILPTRLLTLGLFAGNAGQWDAQVAMVVNAGLHALCAAVLGAILVTRLGAHRQWPVLGVLLVLFCLPFNWQNTLWGFQSQFYFLILFTLVTFWGLASHVAGTARWWCGAGAGLLACLSMGSGGLAGIALAAWLGTKLLLFPEDRRQRGNWATLALAIALGALSFALYTPPKVESLAAMHAKSAGAFLHGLAVHLGWPNSASPFFAVLAWAPLGVLWWCRWRDRRHRIAGDSDAAIDDFLFPLGIWVMLQAAALAWSRNHPMTSVISRYMDLLALGALVNFCCLLHLGSRLPSTQWMRRALLAGGIIWLAVAAAGLVPLLQRNFRLDLPGLHRIQHLQAAAIRQFLSSGRAEDLGGKPVFGLPPADLILLADLLRDPLIQNALPTGLGVRRAPAPDGPLTAASRVIFDAWGLLLGSGAAILLHSSIHQLRSRRRSRSAVAQDNDPGHLSAEAPAPCRTAS